jgi:hypothetical protein
MRTVSEIRCAAFCHYIDWVLVKSAIEVALQTERETEGMISKTEQAIICYFAEHPFDKAEECFSVIENCWLYVPALLITLAAIEARIDELDGQLRQGCYEHSSA